MELRMDFDLKLGMRCSLCGSDLDNGIGHTTAILFGTKFGSTCPLCDSIQDPTNMNWLEKLYIYVNKKLKKIRWGEFLYIIETINEGGEIEWED